MTIKKRALLAATLILALMTVGAISRASNRLPSSPTSNFEGPWEVEPNDSYQQANGPLRSHRAYYGHPNDPKDYFHLLLDKRGRIVVDLSGHAGHDVQLHLYHGTPSEATRVGYDASLPYHLEHTGTAGRYYILVYTGAGHNTSSPYTLRATFPMIHTVYLPLAVKLGPNRLPAIPSAPSPADGSVDQSVDVDLSWSGGDPDGDAVTYDVILEAGDSSPDSWVCADLPIATCDPGQLAHDTQYYWKVVARDAYGATRHGPIWSFRTEAAHCTDPPTIPNDPLPSDGAHGVSVTADLAWSGGHPCSGEDVTYDVYLAANDSTPDIQVCDDATTPFCAVSTLGYSTHYYWQVVAKGLNGPVTGPVWEFWTSSEPCTDPPMTPYNPFPSDGAAGVSVTIGLAWSGGHPCYGETVAYDVYLAANDNTPHSQVCNGTTTPFCAPGVLSYDTHYYWQVVAEGKNGPSPGPVWDFWTGPEPCTDPPTTPYNPFPSARAGGVSINTDLSWSGGHPCAGEDVTYDIYLEANDSTPDTQVCSDAATPFCALGTLRYETHYYWRVVAKGENGPSAGPLWEFWTEEEPCTRPPATAYDPLPTDGANGVSITTDLAWHGGHPCYGEAVTYDVYLEANDSTPDNLMCSDASTPFCALGTLNYDTHYYWRVVAQGSNGPTAGPVWDFGTGHDDPFSNMVPVAAGEFRMGSTEENDEQPVHTVYLDAYYVDAYEVTNAQFAAFLNALGNREEGGVTWLHAADPSVRIHEVGGNWQADAGYEGHPATMLSWHGARAYCQWAGKRLPTEAEWEKAARSTDVRIYPWGNQAPDCSRLNYRHFNGTSLEYCVGDTSPVGSYPSGVSPYGALDMAGNVWEWANDWYGSGYYDVSPYRNPPGPTGGADKVLRGGSWLDDWEYARAARRVHRDPTFRNYHIGFRCAVSP